MRCLWEGRAYIGPTRTRIKFASQLLVQASYTKFHRNSVRSLGDKTWGRAQPPHYAIISLISCNKRSTVTVHSVSLSRNVTRDGPGLADCSSRICILHCSTQSSILIGNVLQTMCLTTIRSDRIVICFISNHKEQSRPSEANSRSSRQEIPRFLWNPKVLCRAHKSPPLDHILNQMNPVHILTFVPRIRNLGARRNEWSASHHSQFSPVENLNIDYYSLLICTAERR